MFRHKKFYLLFSIWLIWSIKLSVKNADNLSELKVVFCDVGQGDATLVAWRDFQLLIDGGPDSSVLRCLREELPSADDTIEMMILTHPDADHFTGLTAALQHYQVKTLLTYNMGKASRDYFDFYTAVWDQLEAGTLQVVAPNLGEQWCPVAQICFLVVSDFREKLPVNIFQNRLSFENLSDMLNKFVQKSYDYNNGSIVIILQVDQLKFILTGDAEEPQELAMLADGLLMDVDVLKTGHHGSKSSSSPLFLAEIKPETAIISCGADNSYGHPHAQTLTRLGELGASVYRTDQQGKIRWVSTPAGAGRWEVERLP